MTNTELDLSNQRRVLTVVMDGIGINPSRFGNAFLLAKTPNLDWLRSNGLYTELSAHGTFVGLPSDSDIGNSEVGHNALGAGRVFSQGAKLVNEAFATGSLFSGSTWNTICDRVGQDHTLHLLGLLSDGNVHSNEQHLHALIRQAKQSGIKRVRVHVLFDGRDVGQKTGEIYVDRLNKVLAQVRSDDFDAKVASGGGRMTITMDRYEADWQMVKRGWDCHVLGKGPQFSDLDTALKHFREDPELTDQYLPAFVIAEDGSPVGTVENGDAVIFFNFRGDRAIEISRAFTEEQFSAFDRERYPGVFYAGMMEYDGDLHIPPSYLVEPPQIKDTLSEWLISKGVNQLACSETQKFGHVTYFWNGNRSGYLDKAKEEYIEIKSDVGITFDERPEMKAREITDAVLAAWERGQAQFSRINYANGDMVGHTGNLEAAVKAVEVVDQEIGRLIQAAKRSNTILLVTADHGNCDEMFEGKEADYPGWESGSDHPKPKTAHTLSPVPCYILDPLASKAWELNQNIQNPSLANIANTVGTLLGIGTEDRFYPALVERKG